MLCLEHIEKGLYERLVRILHDGLNEPECLERHLLRTRVRGRQESDQTLVHLHLELRVAVRQELQQLSRVFLK